MRKEAKTLARNLASIGLMTFAALTSPPVAHATTTTAPADASVVILEPVGAGFSFDLLSDAVSAVFLNGDAGDSVSLLMSRRRPGPNGSPRNEGGVLVMASGVYRIDLLQPTSTSARLRGTMRLQPPGGSSILFLAQFN